MRRFHQPNTVHRTQYLHVDLIAKPQSTDKISIRRSHNPIRAPEHNIKVILTVHKRLKQVSLLLVQKLSSTNVCLQFITKQAVILFQEILDRGMK
jgi:hypothetical protein